MSDFHQQGDEATARSNVSDEALRKATPGGWTEWLGRLDRAGAQDWSHKDIVAFLKAEHVCPAGGGKA